MHIHQKALQYTPVQKVERLFVGLLAGAQAVVHTTTTVRIDPALTTAFGLPGCAEQSVIADTLDAASEADVTALRDALAEILQRYGQAPRHDFQQEVLVLDGDLSPLPASAHAEGSERGYLGRCRSKTGRKLVRMRAASTQEIIWETVVSGRRVESLPILQEAIQQAERLLGTLQADLDRESLTIGRLILRLLVGRDWREATVVPRAPLSLLPGLLATACDLLSTLSFDQGVAGLKVELGRLQSRAAGQLSFFPAPEAESAALSGGAF